MAGRSPVLQHPHVLLQSLLLLPELLVLGAELLHPPGLPVGDAPGGRRALPGAWAGSCGALRPGDFPVKGTLRGQCLTQHARARTRPRAVFVSSTCRATEVQLVWDMGTRGHGGPRAAGLQVSDECACWSSQTPPAPGGRGPPSPGRASTHSVAVGSSPGSAGHWRRDMDRPRPGPAPGPAQPSRSCPLRAMGGGTLGCQG